MIIRVDDSRRVRVRKSIAAVGSLQVGDEIPAFIGNSVMQALA